MISDSLFILIVVAALIGAAFALLAGFQRGRYVVLTGVVAAALVVIVGWLLGVR